MQDEGLRDGYLAVSQRGGHCAPVVQLADSSGDESHQADSAGFSMAPRAHDSSPGGCLAAADSDPLQADDLSPGGCSADLCRDDGSAVTAPADSAGWRVDDSAVRD